MKPYGVPGATHDLGYGLPLLLGYLESLVSDESDTLPPSGKGARWKRHELVEAAIENLSKAAEMGDELAHHAMSHNIHDIQAMMQLEISDHISEGNQR